MSKSNIGAACGCAALLFLPGMAAAEETSVNYTVSAGLEIYHGNYGTDESTDTVSFLPAVALSFSDNLTATLVVPYLYLSNNATVPVGGGHFPMSGSGQAAMPDTGRKGHMGPPGDGHPAHHPPPEFSDEPRNGPGDVMLTVDYGLWAENEKSPSVSAELYVKFPTANEDKGLGTGAYDYGVGFSLGKGLASWQLDAEVLYIMPGSTPAYELVNYWDWSLSSSYLVSDQLSLGMGVAGATNPFAGTKDLLEVELLGSFWTSPRAGIWAVVSFGLNDSTADYGLGVYGAVIF